MPVFVPDHQSQYAPGASPITRTSGCSWTAAANGVTAVTGGKRHPTPDHVHAQVARHEETDPGSPGWSIPDVRLALGRMGIEFVDRSGDGWDAVVAELERGRYVVLQGDSDQFGNTTCSGAFDGNHAIGILPRAKIEGGVAWWWINDSICKTGRWERESVLRRYAEKLNRRCQFGSFTRAVPQALASKPTPKVVLRRGARKLAHPTVKTVHTRSGRGRRRTAPHPRSRITARPRNGRRWTAYQVITNKSGRWFGNRTNTRWMRASAF